ncbi:MAG TPA: right-handed parallel beta-helix repeat-containing protein [Gaiellaceae bacterium]|nr:right-handed parallel beta-helix repeat-containing protein [Gaiellaceae bacterium]
MAYTLRGRVETRLAGAIVPVLVAAVLAPILHKWWPLELAGLMLLIGLTLDVVVYHHLLPYQPGWAAVPLGLLELGLTMAAARLLELGAPLQPAVLFFAGSWLLAQLLAHAVLPLLHLTWPEDGGELGRAGPGLSAAAPVALVAVLGIAWAVEPPTVRLEAGMHEGPLVLDHAQTVVGEEGAIVRGGIRITADDVTLRNLTVQGGEYGIEVRDAESIELDGVVVESAELDGINARQSELEIRDCEIRSLPGTATQGIDISFASQLPASLVEDCLVVGGSEGIVSHMANVMVRDNRVRSTELRGIAVTEMSMGDVEDNLVEDALGIGIFCGDYSHCSIEDNRVTGMRPDPSGNPTRAGLGLVAHYGAVATVGGNTLERPPASFIGARIESR